MKINNEFWTKVEKFQFEKSPQEYGFVTRLAYENAWTEVFTQQAILEYKKFMFLVAISPEMLSPSKIVDVVWHQHLIYSDSYKNFCTLLGKEIQHLPSTHDAKEQSSFEEAFVKTEKIYKENFHESDWDFWKIKSDLDLLNFTVKPPRFDNYFLLFLSATFVFTGVLFFLIKPILVQIYNPEFMIGYVVFCVLSCYVLRYVVKNKFSTLIKEKGGWLIENLSPNELISLKTNGVQSVVDVTLYSLIQENQLKILDKSLTVIHKRISHSVPEKAVRNSFLKKDFLDYRKLLNHLKVKNCFLQYTKSTRRIIENIKKSKEIQNIYILVICFLAFVFSIGLCRLILGISRDRPIFIILFWCVLIFVFFNYIFMAKLNGFFQNSFVASSIYFHKKKAVNQGDLAFSFLFLGSAVFGSEFISYTYSVNTYNNDGSYTASSNSSSSCSSSSSSSCSSGSSCGSSCGGCGGGGD